MNAEFFNKWISKTGKKGKVFMNLCDRILFELLVLLSLFMPLSHRMENL